MFAPSQHRCYQVKTNVRTRHYCRWSLGRRGGNADSNSSRFTTRPISCHLYCPSPTISKQKCSASYSQPLYPKGQGDTSIQAVHPQDGEAIQHGRIYVAPPDYHLLIKNGYVRLVRGPRENSHRPAVDPLFRTAARVYGQRVVGVVLSGTLDDGTAGLLAIKQRGGVAIVQDPDEALYSGMPRSAIENVDIDYILRVSEIPSMLQELAYKSVEMERTSVSSEMEMEADVAELELEAMHDFNRPGKPSGFGCPECGGSLWELQEGSLIRFRCRTGHAFSTGSLMAEQSEALETALWMALRALEEKAALVHRLAGRARDRRQPLSAERFAVQAQVAQQRATLIRQLLLKEDSEPIATDPIGGNGGNGQVVRVDSSVRVQGDGLKPLQSATAKAIDFKVVALCASAGGLKALSQILSALPANIPCAITVLQHLSPQHSSQLAEILSRRTTLAVKEAEAGDVLHPGKVYIAPPDHHLLVNSDGTLSLSHTELVHFVRPSADLLLESMAASLKQQAIAVVLTGSGVDGAMGVSAIKQMGGSVVVQNQATSEVFGMPGAAIATGSTDRIVSLDEIAATLVELVAVADEASQEL